MSILCSWSFTKKSNVIDSLVIDILSLVQFIIQYQQSVVFRQPTLNKSQLHLN